MWVPHIYRHSLKWIYDVISSWGGAKDPEEEKALRCTLPSPLLPSHPFIHFVHLNLRESGGSHGVLFFSGKTSNHPSLLTPFSRFSLRHLLCLCRRCLARWRFRSQVRKLQQSLRIGNFFFFNFKFCFFNWNISCPLPFILASSVLIVLFRFAFTPFVCSFILGRSNFVGWMIMLWDLPMISERI